MFNVYALGEPETALPALSIKPYGETVFAGASSVRPVATGLMANQ